MRSFEDITPMSQGDAHEFYNNGMKQLDNLLIGEHEAKEATLVAMASGLNVVLVGHPGGGKTTLGEDSYRLIGDINPDQVAILPVQADLQPQQITGGEANTTKVTTVGKDEFAEEIKIAIASLFNEDTKVIFANEINRVNPLAINAMLEVLESGKLDSTGGRTMIDLEYATSTMNPAEKRQGVFPMAAAAASRHAIGVELGADNRNGERDMTIRNVFGGWEPQPDSIKPVLNLDDLHALRARTNDFSEIPTPDSVAATAVNVIKATHDVLKNNWGIAEGDARLAKQMGKIARTLAVLHGENAVSEEHLKQATRLIVGARIGILGTGAVATNASEITDQIYERV